MRRRGKRIVRGGLAMLAGGVAAGLFVARKMRSTRDKGSKVRRDREHDRWARPGMEVIFRAELMPSRETEERTFRVVELLPSGRVRLDGVAGEHTENEFEPLR
ncbi:MAG: hypothetical protein QOE33_3280 [Acidobacteriota bacterium]|nr:hypothetical protein [Acidobacteriota bacterium]